MADRLSDEPEATRRRRHFQELSANTNNWNFTGRGDTHRNNSIVYAEFKRGKLESVYNQRGTHRLLVVSSFGKWDSDYDNSSSKAFASRKSIVSNPSVKPSKTSERRPRASFFLP